TDGEFTSVIARGQRGHGPRVRQTEKSGRLLAPVKEPKIDRGNWRSVEGSDRYQIARNQEAIVAAHWPLVRRVALRIHRRVPRSIDLESLLQSGTLGLLEAATRFDPDRGAAYAVYAQHRIEGEMLEHLRSLDWVSRSICM